MSVLLLLNQAASEQHAGSGSLAASASLTSAGQKAASGAGTLTASTSFAAAGRRSAAGTGTLTGSPAFSAATRKAGNGAAAVTAAATATAAGWKACDWPGHLNATASLSASGSASQGGPEEHAGDGALVLEVAFGAVGVSSEAPVVVSVLPMGRHTRRTRRETEARAGVGVLHLTARLAATGTKTFERDDELVLAIAA